MDIVMDDIERVAAGNGLFDVAPVTRTQWCYRVGMPEKMTPEGFGLGKCQWTTDQRQDHGQGLKVPHATME